MKINISIFPDILEEYLVSRKKFVKNAFEYDIATIIENPYNILIVSRKYIDFLDRIFTTESELYDDYTNFITYRIDNNSEIVESSESDTIQGEFVNIEKESTSTIISIFRDKISLEGISNILCINEIGTCLKSKVFLSLLKDRKSIVRYNDFTDNEDLKDFLQKVFNLPKHQSSVVIFDRYANINHPYFDFFNQKQITVKYYKLRADLLDGNSLKRKFNKIELYNTTNAELIHERTLILGNLIMNIDEDPMNLDVSRKTWTITLVYSAIEANELRKKCIQFSKVAYV